MISWRMSKTEKRLKSIVQGARVMVKIEEYIDIQAGRDKVWEVISDFSREKEFWHGIKDVKILSQSGNVIEREVTQNFRNYKVLQRVVIHPGNSIQIFHVRGVTKGVQVIFIEPIKEGLTRLNVAWNVGVKGLMWFVTPFVKRHIREGTVNALKRIKSVCESSTQKIPKAE